MNDVSGPVSFLQARIAEDEQVAQAAIGTAVFQRQTGRWSFDHVTDQYGPIPIVFAIADGGAKTQVADFRAAWERQERGTHIARWDPARVLAECEAKRRIIEAAADYSPELEHGDNGEYAFDLTLRLLTRPYAGHPDYRPEWTVTEQTR